jgi:sugar transferase (PEP-CTERM/EpsH1 system associated)
MKILFTCHRLPYPPKRGGKIRPFNIIKHLTEQGHSVTVGSLARSEDELREGEGLREHCHKLLVGRIGEFAAGARMVARLPTTVPSSMGFFYSRSLHNAVRVELRRGDYDLVFVHCSSAAQYAQSKGSTPSIIDFGDMDSQKWLDYSRFRRFPLSMGYWLEGRKLAAAEKRLAASFDMSTCTTRAERDTLEGFNAARDIDWFPNGVDADFFAPSEQPYDPDIITFVGRMDYFPNQKAVTWFCDNVFPEIRNKRPTARFQVVGAEPSREIRSLADRPGVQVTGTVQDVRTYVSRSALTVAPLSIARGTQNKILESMAMGVPVVCSDLAAGGVDAQAGEHLVTADDVSSYVEAVLKMMDDRGHRDKVAAAGRSRVLSHHHWQNSMRRLDTIIERLLAERNTHSSASFRRHRQQA